MMSSLLVSTLMLPVYLGWFLCALAPLAIVLLPFVATAMVVLKPVVKVVEKVEAEIPVIIEVLVKEVLVPFVRPIQLELE